MKQPRRLLRGGDARHIERAWDQLAQQARDQLAAEGVAPERSRIKRSAALHYHGQTYLA